MKYLGTQKIKIILHNMSLDIEEDHLGASLSIGEVIREKSMVGIV